MLFPVADSLEEILSGAESPEEREALLKLSQTMDALEALEARFALLRAQGRRPSRREVC